MIDGRAPRGGELGGAARGGVVPYREKEDLILVGAYHEGSDRGVDAALRLRPNVLEFLQQRPDEYSAIDSSSKRSLLSIASQIDQATRRS